MSKSNWPKDQSYIWGSELLFNEFKYENKNEVDTLNFITKDSDINLKDQFDGIGSALSLLSQIASCAWGCSGGNHLKENLIRRLANYCFATIRLTNLGLYNESLSLLRSAGELANVIKLFSRQHNEFETWSNFSSKERWDSYKPERTRQKLKDLAIPEIMNQETYSELCGIGIHPSIEFALISHQESGNVYIGSEFSKEAIVIIYNELASILAQILDCVGGFMKTNIEHQKTLREASQAIDSLKNANLDLPTYINQIEKDGFANLSIDSSKTQEFLVALSKHNIYLIVTNKPKKFLEVVNETGNVSVTIYTTKYNNKDIVPIFTTERKAKAYISSLSPEDQKNCKELKLIISPLVEASQNATIFLNYATKYQREITIDEISELRRLIAIEEK